MTNVYYAKLSHLVIITSPQLFEYSTEYVTPNLSPCPSPNPSSVNGSPGPSGAGSFAVQVEQVETKYCVFLY